MRYLKILSILCAIIITSSISLYAVPAAFKKDLKEPRAIITKCKSNVFYKNKYDGATEQLDKAEMMLKKVAEKAGVDESDPDIKRLLKSIKEVRKKLKKELAKQGKAISIKKPKGPVKKPEKAAVRKAAQPTLKVTPVKADPESGLKALYKRANNAFNDLYYKKKYEGKDKEINQLEAQLNGLMQEFSLSESDSGVKRVKKKITALKKEYEKHAAKLAKQKSHAESQAKARAAKTETMAGQEKVFDENKSQVVILHKIIEKMYKAKSDQEFYNLAIDGRVVVQEAEKILKNIHGGIPHIGKFASENAEAKTMNLSRKVSQLETWIDRVKHKLEVSKSTLLNQVENDLGSMKYYKKMSFVSKEYENIKRKFQILENLAPGDSEVKAAKQKILPEAKKMVDSFMAKVAEIRMPKDKYSEGDIDPLKAKVAQLYAAKYAGDKVERVVITSEDWIAQARAEVNNDGNLEAGFYKYIYTHIAVKKKSGYSVYLIGFRKTWTGTGEEFGPLQLHSIGDNYPILAENIKK